MDKFSENAGPDVPRRTAKDRQHSASRERILRALELGGSATVSALSRSTGLHENTVRGHLTRLEADGYARRESGAQSVDPLPETGRGRGRPTVTWSAVAPEELGPYAGLAATLADALAETGDDGAALAREAGERWGAKLAEGIGGTRSAREAVLSVMREQGFAPEETDDGDIVLTRCPLLAAAAKRADIVCAVHAGMIAGISRSAGNEAVPASSLLPFVTPDSCQIHLKFAS
ncbi:helix-turn-helix transcriptional regulator [Leucobacter denitrificans]|uniref:Helix-turn-helix domain-containing protein n=1 Tax=Leucobacter denitrificans TaxID=683042 RepID=A0A7G9S7E8_9MICO|nr:helix-turn-helix domain-containing protein [Leucobacter denitrificans]QNN63773.1 helix-turn-helix domain-containing protein [Leucobacter denitrificans]